VETASTYFTRRARQERTNAADAHSSEARKAHLELAFRLVRVATEPALWEWSQNGEAGSLAHHRVQAGLDDALAGAFPLPASGSFDHLLEAVNTAECRLVSADKRSTSLSKVALAQPGRATQ
jgi:hypothetical protein